jgi:hypothetical protein
MNTVFHGKCLMCSRMRPRSGAPNDTLSNGDRQRWHVKRPTANQFPRHRLQ